LLDPSAWRAGDEAVRLARVETELDGQMRQALLMSAPAYGGSGKHGKWASMERRIDSRTWLRGNTLEFWVKGVGPRCPFIAVRMRSGWTAWRGRHYADAVHRPFEPDRWVRVKWQYGPLPEDIPERLILTIRVPTLYLCATDQRMSYSFAGLELKTEEVRKDRGWEPTEIVVSPVGYEPHQRKTAIVPHQEETNEVRILAVGTGRACWSGQLATRRNEIGRFGVADFSDFTASGRYCLAVGDMRSDEFRIGDGIWGEVTGLALTHLFNWRNGYRSHLDDALNDHTREHVDLRGGWFDAGDMMPYPTNTMRSAENLVYAYRNGLFADRDGDGVSDLYDERAWGERWMLNVLGPDDLLPGRMYALHNGTRVHPDYFTDNIVGTADDRIYPYKAGDKAGYFLDYYIYAGVMADAASAYRDSGDGAKRDQFLDKAIRAWRHVEQDGHRVHLKYRPRDEIEFEAHLLLYNSVRAVAAVALREAGAECGGLLEAVDESIDTVLSLQSREIVEQGDTIVSGFFLNGRGKGSYPFQNTGFIAPPVQALARALAHYPRGSEVWFRVYATAKVFCKFYILPMCEMTAPYYLFPTGLKRGPDGAKRYGFAMRKARRVGRYYTYFYHLSKWRSYRNRFELRLGVRLTELARELNEPELARHTRNACLWRLGRNPFNTSFMVGFGKNSPVDILSMRNGISPGSIVVGTRETEDDEPFYKLNSAGYTYGKEPWSVVNSTFLECVSLLAQPCTLSFATARGLRRPVVTVRGGGGGVLWQGRGRRLELCGNRRLTVRCGERARVIRTVCGASHEVDLTGELEYDLLAEVPKRLIAGQRLELPVRVRRRRGAKRAVLKLWGDGVLVDGGRVYEFPVAGDRFTVRLEAMAPGPYYLAFSRDDRFANERELWGAILPSASDRSRSQ